MFFFFLTLHVLNRVHSVSFSCLATLDTPGYGHGYDGTWS